MAPVSEATRTITITPTTNAVNVDEGEVVKFVANGHEFAFKFDGSDLETSVDLQRVAPAGMLDHQVIAYVEPATGGAVGKGGNRR